MLSNPASTSDQDVKDDVGLKHMQETLRAIPASRLAAHMHDTYGQVSFPDRLEPALKLVVKC